MNRRAPQRKKSLTKAAKTRDVRKKGNQKKASRATATRETTEDQSIIGNGGASPALPSKGKDEKQKKDDEKKILKTMATLPTNEEESLIIAKTMASESTISIGGAPPESKGSQSQIPSVQKRARSPRLRDKKGIREEASREQPFVPGKGAPDTVDVEPSLPVKPARAVRPTPAKIRAKRSTQEKRKSLRSLRQKTSLKSRPMQEKSIIQLAAKVKKRRSRTSRPQKVRSAGEDAYPQARPGKPRRRKRVKQATKEEEFVPRIDSAFLLPEADMFVQLGQTMNMAVKPSGDILPNTGLPMVHGNKDNSGVIIVDGQPFWATNIPPDDTDDELVMNADVLIDVLEKRLKLVPMPDIEIVLDPMEETTVMAARDKTCYTKDVVFGNTVRSMVNLNELSVRTLSNRSRKKQVAKIRPDELNQLAMEEPKVLHTYYRTTYDQSTAVPFTPTPKQTTSQPPSCTADLNPFAAVTTIKH